MTELLSLIGHDWLTTFWSVLWPVLSALGLAVPFLKAGAAIILFLWVFAVLFIAAMGVYRLHLSGKLYERLASRLVTRWVCYPLVALAYLVDFVAQFTVASLFFWDWPPKGERLVTDRLQRYLNNERITSRRGSWAHHICTELDLFDPTGDHCNRSRA